MLRKRVFVAAGAAVAVTLAGVAAFSVVMWGAPSRASAATTNCTATGFHRNGINLTARLINPSGVVSGKVDASGCNIGVYYDSGVTGTVNNAEVYGANYFGVVNNGAVVTVENSKIHDIGESPLNGSQHGVGVYWAPDNIGTGRIVNNTVWNYQKGGIVVNGTGSSAEVSGNTVSGQGPVDYIAQNGIQIGFGATATVMRNTVTGNSYTGNNQADSVGILLVGGPCYGSDYTMNVQIVGNTLAGNDVGVLVSNVDTDCLSAPATPTNVTVVNNTISNDGLHNRYTFGSYVGYQAGVADQGDNDKIIHNAISGAGYDPTANPGAYTVAIDADASLTNHAKIHANVIQ